LGEDGLDHSRFQEEKSTGIQNSYFFIFSETTNGGGREPAIPG
jgi:hypothetical protein